jgi:uncharacterized membrane protein
MTGPLPKLSRLEILLAGLLHYGSWLASSAIALGLALAMIDTRAGTHDLAGLPNMRLATGGIALLILLPILRVSLMLFAFLRERDYRLALAAVLVLAIILAGVMIGLRTAASQRFAPGQTNTAERMRRGIGGFGRVTEDSEKALLRVGLCTGSPATVQMDGFWLADPAA